MKTLIFRIETQENFTNDETAELQKIFQALIQTGGLVGMKNGSTNIHFDDKGVFQGIRFDYWPWKRKKV